MIIEAFSNPVMQPWHYVLIVIGFAIAICLAVAFRKFDDGKNRKLLMILGILFPLGEVFKQILMAKVIGYQEYPLSLLPLQFCLIPLYILLPMALLKDGVVKRALYNYMVSFSLVAATVYLFSGIWTTQPSSAFEVHEFVWHAAVVFVSFYIALSGRIDTNIKGVLGALSVFAILVGIGLLSNELLRDVSDNTTNFFFLGQGNPGIYILKVITASIGRTSANLGFQSGFGALSVTAFLVMCIPSLVRERIAAKSKIAAEPERIYSIREF
ncbi:MAG: YwaF family protein [Clostridiales Family XIII bacterium]|jgi:hypothetical protein|nr:YwaF family protein [Clostridiales Family XIII bacterium]